jgi:hypothetical protein
LLRLSSGGSDLGEPGEGYLVCQPKAGEPVSVELKPGPYRYERFALLKGEAAGSGRLESSVCAQQFNAPFDGEAVLQPKADGCPAR